MQPLKQYDSQLRITLLNKIFDSIEPQVEDDLQSDLSDKLQYELWQETLRFTLYEELENRWYP